MNIIWIYRYANDVTHSVRFLVLTIVGGSAAAILFVGLTLVSVSVTIKYEILLNKIKVYSIVLFPILLI